MWFPPWEASVDGIGGCNPLAYGGTTDSGLRLCFESLPYGRIAFDKCGCMLAAMKQAKLCFKWLWVSWWYAPHPRLTTERDQLGVSDDHVMEYSMDAEQMTRTLLSDRHHVPGTRYWVPFMGHGCMQPIWGMDCLGKQWLFLCSNAMWLSLLPTPMVCWSVRFFFS